MKDRQIIIKPEEAYIEVNGEKFLINAESVTYRLKATLNDLNYSVLKERNEYTIKFKPTPLDIDMWTRLTEAYFKAAEATQDAVYRHQALLDWFQIPFLFRKMISRKLKKKIKLIINSSKLKEKENGFGEFTCVCYHDGWRKRRIKKSSLYRMPK